MKHIRIISPAGCIEADIVQGAQKTLEEWGFRVSLGDHALGVYGRYSADCDDRLADFVDAWHDDTVDYILCSRGGYGMQQMIDRLADMVLTDHRATPPEVIGFSDISEFHALCAIRGIPSIHGGMACQLAGDAANPAVCALQSMLMGTAMHYRFPGVSFNRLGTVSARLVGGNLSVLYGLQGTPYGLNAAIGDDYPILLVEDIGEKHYHIDRMMHNLRLSGVLDRIGGLMIGYFTDCDDDPSMLCSLMESIHTILQGRSYPVAYAIPVGHEEPNYPLHLGIRHTLTVSAEGVSLVEG